MYYLAHNVSLQRRTVLNTSIPFFVNRLGVVHLRQPRLCVGCCARHTAFASGSRTRLCVVRELVCFLQLSSHPRLTKLCCAVDTPCNGIPSCSHRTLNGLGIVY